MEDTALIKYVIKTLGDIEIKGKENLNKLLGCICALEEVLKNNEEKAEVVENGG